MKVGQLMTRVSVLLSPMVDEVLEAGYRDATDPGSNHE